MVDELFSGWNWLNQNAWIASALLVVALTGASATMAWHIHESRSARYNYLVIAGLVLMAVSFVLTGISVGERPIWPGRQLIPMIRILWLSSALIFNGYLCACWARRLKWKRQPSRQTFSSQR